jgi:Ankyrin repeats (3 copies)
LHNAHKQCGYLLARQHEVKKLRLAAGNSVNEEDERCFIWIITFLDFAISWAKKEFTSWSRGILELLEEIDLQDRESFLLRLRAALEAFAITTNESCHPIDRLRTTDVRMSALQGTVLQQLIHTYDLHGDDLEAHRLRQQSAFLSTGAETDSSDVELRQEAKAFCAISTAISTELAQTLQNLDHNNPYMRLLEPFKAKLFPPIQIALLNRRDAAARFLCTNMQCGLNEVDILGRHALHVAAELSSLEFLEFIIHRDPNMLKLLLKKRDFWSLTVLCVAAYIGHLGFFKALINAGAKLDEQDGQGRGVLYYACAAGNISIVSYLLDQNVNPNDTMQSGSPLHGAAAAGHEEICRKLVAKGAWVLWAPYRGRTAREVAYANGHTALAEFLSNAEKAQSSRLVQDVEPAHEDSPSIAPFSRTPRSTSLTLPSTPSPPLLETQVAPQTEAKDWLNGISSSTSVRHRSVLHVLSDGQQPSPRPIAARSTPSLLPPNPIDWNNIMAPPSITAAAALPASSNLFGTEWPAVAEDLSFLFSSDLFADQYPQPNENFESS